MSDSPSPLPLLDLVIVIDTSPSMRDIASSMSDITSDDIASSGSNLSIDLRLTWLGVEGHWQGTEFKRSIRSYLTEECGVSETQLRGRKRGELSLAGAQEDTARAIEDISKYFDWRETAARGIFYLGDEALDGGGSEVQTADIEATNLAIQSAKSAQVCVHMYFGTSKSKHRSSIEQEYARVAAETHGQCFTAEDNQTNFSTVLETIISSSRPTSIQPESNAMAKKATRKKNDEAVEIEAAETPEPKEDSEATGGNHFSSLTSKSSYKDICSVNMSTPRRTIMAMGNLPDISMEEKRESICKNFRRGRIWA